MRKIAAVFPILLLLLAVAFGQTANFSGGAIPFHFISSATTNSLQVKTGAGTLYSVVAAGNTTSPYFLKLYDVAVAPTCGTTVPFHTIEIPGTATVTTGNLSVVPVFPVGLLLSNGLGICITANINDTDTTATPASAVVINLGFK